MPISFTSVQKKAALTLWSGIAQAPIQFALVPTPEPVLQVYKKPQDAPNAMKVLEGLRKSVTGFAGTTVQVGRVELDGTNMRVVVDKKRSTGQALSQANFVKLWKAGAKTIGLDRAGQLIDKASFGEEEGEEVEGETATDTTGGTPKSSEKPSSDGYQPAPGMPSATVVNRSRLVWIGARSTAAAELDKLMNAIYADPDVKENAQLRVAAAGLKKSGWSLDVFDDRLITALDTLTSAPVTGQAAAFQKCNQILAEYRRALDTDPVLARIDANPFKTVAVRSSIQKALDALDKALRAT